MTTLDEFRLGLIERLRVCRDTAAARSLLADAELVLTNAKLTQLTHDRFWETLEEDLERLREEAKLMPDRQAFVVLDAVVAAARARIARYRAQREQGESSSAR